MSDVISHIWFYKGEPCNVLSAGTSHNVVDQLMIARKSNPDERILVFSNEEGVFPDLEYTLVN